MNILDLLGVAIFFGILGGKFFQKIKVPQVVAYIFLGLIIGRSLLHIFEASVVDSLEPVVNFTLGVIGLTIGAELKFDVFRKYGKSIYYILVSEGVLAFALVTVGVWLISGNLAMGLLLGAVASATDPASTVNVLWEYKGKGALTTTVTSIVALDDGLALIIYGLASVFAQSMIAHESFSLLASIGKPLLEIFYCLLFGAVAGSFIVCAIKWIKEKELVLAFTLGMICIVVGGSIYLHLDLILCSMAMGCLIINTIPEESEKLFAKIREMSVSLYVLFFVVVGAQLDIHIFGQASIVILVAGYLVARSSGKIFGAMLGGLMAKAPKKVTKFSGICLFTQGGVAMGLAMSINRNLAGAGDEAAQVGVLIMNVIAATTFVVQVCGPLLVKLALHASGEANRNVTRADVLEELKVEDAMLQDFAKVGKGATLRTIINTVREKDSYQFTVTDKEGRLQGVISLNELKHALLEEGLQDIILADDISVAAKFSLKKGVSLSDAAEIFSVYSVDYIPVIEDDESRKVVGIVEKTVMEKRINRVLLERHGEIGAA